jgi:hypothetical protein
MAYDSLKQSLEYECIYGIHNRLKYCNSRLQPLYRTPEWIHSSV